MAKAFAFDIDGVLLRGSQTLPNAKPALEFLNSQKVPWMLLTNGGGKSEKERVADLSKAIGIDIDPLQFMQSHTPFMQLAPQADRVLVIGGDQDKCRHIAEEYGFRDVVLPCDIGLTVPSIVPYDTMTSAHMHALAHKIDDPNKPFDAILVFNDTRDATADVQIIVDLLLSENGVLGTRRAVEDHSEEPSVPIFFSNGDLEWSTDHAHPRIGQGAFIAMIKGLYFELTGFDLDHTVIGKPTKITYDYASNVLRSWVGEDQKDELDIYMVGDNQLSDIRGANDYGWKSVLVRSGVYKNSDELITRPTFICDDVLAAVKTACAAPHEQGAGGVVTSVKDGIFTELIVEDETILNARSRSNSRASSRSRSNSAASSRSNSLSRSPRPEFTPLTPMTNAS